MKNVNSLQSHMVAVDECRPKRDPSGSQQLAKLLSRSDICSQRRVVADHVRKEAHKRFKRCSASRSRSPRRLSADLSESDVSRCDSAALRSPRFSRCSLVLAIFAGANSAAVRECLALADGDSLPLCCKTFSIKQDPSICHRQSILYLSVELRK